MKRKKKQFRGLPDLINASLTKNFTQIPNILLRSRHISGKAKALLCLLLSNKEGWKSHIITITNMMKENKDAINSGLRELEKHGYLIRVKCREKKSKKLCGWIWAYTDIRNSLDMEYILALLDENKLEAVVRKTTIGFSTYGSATYGKSESNNIKDNNSNSDIKLHSSRSKTDHTVESISKPKKVSIPERSKAFIPQATKLKKIVQSYKQIKITGRVLTEWTNQIRILVEQQQVKVKRIDVVLEWYKDHYADPYTPVIESGCSLKQKFTRLEDAVGRSSDLPTTVSSEISPKKTIRQKLNGKQVGIKNSMLRNYDKVIELLPDLNKVEVSKNLCDLYDWVVKNTEDNVETQSEEFYDEIGPPEYVVGMYAEWVNDQEWIDGKTANLFKPNSKVFKNFIESKSKEIGKHILTGNYI